MPGYIVGFKLGKSDWIVRVGRFTAAGSSLAEAIQKACLLAGRTSW